MDFNAADKHDRTALPWTAGHDSPKLVTSLLHLEVDTVDLKISNTVIMGHKEWTLDGSEDGFGHWKGPS